MTPDEEEQLQILSDPAAAKKKTEKDKTRPPFEFFKSQVTPFDVLPFVKANHWSTFALELRANEEDYDGYLQTVPVLLRGMPLELIYRRDARLLKEQRARLPLQVMLNEVPKEWMIDMAHSGALRPDASWQASLTTLPPHQMLILILSKEATNQFAAWNRMTASIPATTDREVNTDLEKERYYRLVLPMEPDKPALSSHPLTWSTISHVIWDDQAPDVLSVSQQQALVDWLHWGGQLILTGGAGQSFSLYRESFLGPYLPADATGETVGLAQVDLQPLSQAYPPPMRPPTPGDESQPVPLTTEEALERYARSYGAPVPIQPAPKRPVFLSVLRARPGSSTIPLGEASPHLLAVERRVGRGRITMLTINPNEPSLLAWPGLDTLVRRLILRRPEEPIVAPGGSDGTHFYPPRRGRLLGWDLSWYRITSRDAGSVGTTPTINSTTGPRGNQPGYRPGDLTNASNASNDTPGVADWRDGARIPRLARDLLEQASGITIPSSLFVLRVILAYLIVVVPLNWLVCRYVLNRREWAWFIVPLVALGFAISVERVAARDMGYDTASDEIDLIEMQSEYPRAHLTRLGSLYTNGRSRFSITYPNEPTALVLPLDNGRSIRGEDITTSIFQSYPVPGLIGLAVQPRSLSLFRAEQMLSLRGALRLEGEAGKKRLVNDSELELRGAILIDVAGPGQRQERYVGTIGSGATVEIDGPAPQEPPERIASGPGPDPNPFLEELRTTWESRDENSGEIRLVAWVPGTIGGQAIDPPVDRRRGFTAILIHLRNGNPPGPDGPRYNLMAPGADQSPGFDIDAFKAEMERPVPVRGGAGSRGVRRPPSLPSPPPKRARSR